MKAQIVSFHCVLKNQLGNFISSTFNQDVLTGTPGGPDTLRALSDGLSDLKKGERRVIALRAAEAYGFYDPELVIQMPKKTFPPEASFALGSEVFLGNSAGERKSFIVVATHGDSVTLDGNHPLAGQDLVFEIEATDARDATRDELREAGDARVTDSNRVLH